MAHRHFVVDADSHKCENPLVFGDFIPEGYRERLSFIRDRFGEQRFRIIDRNPESGANDFARVFLQPEGYGKGTYRPYHAETTIGGLFNRVRLEHMDREGIDHQVLYGSIVLAFNSLIDSDLAVVLCRAYNDYIHADVAGNEARLHPIAILPLQDPTAAVEEMRRCVLELGMPGVCIPPNLPMPHPDAPDRFPDVRVPKPLSHPDFQPVFAAAQELGVSLAIHGAPGMQLAGGTSDQLDTFTLVHVFANRSMQQMAIAHLIFDGVMEAYPDLKFGFLEAGVGWVPDFFHGLHEHWEKRIAHFDPAIEPSPREFLFEFMRERHVGGNLALVRKGRNLLSALFHESEREVAAEELEAFRYEHPKLERDPLEYLERGQLFFTVEPDDPAPAWLPHALGASAERICGLAIDYGHWDATLEDCVGLVANRPGVSNEYASRLLATNALDFYGKRLKDRIAPARTESAIAAGATS
jgi:predicted TIM-barrel fold metal-dependent hydrolase